jgi:hypothetical protein
VLQGHAIQILDHNERLICVLADLVNRADVGMVEGRSRASLATKSFERLRVSRQFIGQEFEGDEAAKLSVLSLVHHTHPSTAELLNDSVVRDGLAHELGGRNHWREW